MGSDCILQVRLTAFQSLGAFISTFADPSLTGLHLSDRGNILYCPSSGTDKSTNQSSASEMWVAVIFPLADFNAFWCGNSRENLTLTAYTFAHCNHLIPWEIQSFFQQYYSYRLHIITLSQKKQTATVVLQLICLLTVVYCFLLSAYPYSVVSFYYFWSVIFKATNAKPQLALFRVTNIWRNATLPACRQTRLVDFKYIQGWREVSFSLSQKRFLC